MKIEYEESEDMPPISKMIVTFENEEEWYSLVYNDSWIAKAIIANTSRGGLVWGEHVRNVMSVTAKDLNKDQLKLLKKIEKMIAKCKREKPS